MKGIGILCIAVGLIVVAEIARRFGMEAPIPLQWKLFLAAPFVVWLVITVCSSGGEDS